MTTKAGRKGAAAQDPQRRGRSSAEMSRQESEYQPDERYEAEDENYDYHQYDVEAKYEDETDLEGLGKGEEEEYSGKLYRTGRRGKGVGSMSPVRRRHIAETGHTHEETGQMNQKPETRQVTGTKPGSTWEAERESAGHSRSRPQRSFELDHGMGRNRRWSSSPERRSFGAIHRKSTPIGGRGKRM